MYRFCRLAPSRCLTGVLELVCSLEFMVKGLGFNASSGLTCSHLNCIPDFRDIQVPFEVNIRSIIEGDVVVEVDVHRLDLNRRIVHVHCSP